MFPLGTFCLVEPLQQFVTSSSRTVSFPCPLCRYQKVALPVLKGVTVCVQTQGLLYSRQSGEALPEKGGGECCGVCEQQATHSCRECEILLCESCTKCHQTLSVSRSHVLINLGDISTEKPFISMQRFCEIHKDEKFRFYCLPCDKVICRDCKLTDHEGHKTKNISDVADEARTSLDKTKIELEKHKAQVEKSLDKTNRDYNMLEKTKQAEAEINNFSDLLLDSVNNIINSARRHETDRMKDLHKIHEKSFSSTKCTLQQRKCILETQIQYADSLLREGIDFDVITTNKEMKQRLAEMEKEQDSGPDCDYRSLDMAPIKPVNTDQLEVISSAVRDIIKTSFPVTCKHDVPNVLRIKNIYRRVRCISFTRTKKVWIVGGYDTNLNLCLFYTKSPFETPVYSIKVKHIDKLIKKGVRSVIQTYNKPEQKIPAEEFFNLKKGFPFSDAIDGNTMCKIDREYDIVIIKTAGGIVKILNSSPFSETGRRFEPLDVCWGNNKEIYIVDGGENVIVVYSLQNGFQKSLKLQNKSTLSTVAMDPEGKLWVGDDRGNLFICSVN
ncbi:uncharacterized protein LOC121379685 [Gigantopelta aegis]|uniref:uncharacterized protein LOC121379685 n=1 Tax=Gigantopelta aegis TaxID=1735272 RepID=UPI001B889549|nr:uncharacterized protein LOC121379685 [Gigantopelta aegis]